MATAKGYTPAFGRRISYAIACAGGVLNTSRKLEVNKDTPARWRDGETKISLFHVHELARAAGVNPSWLAFGESTPTGDAATEITPELVEKTALDVLSDDTDRDPASTAAVIRARIVRQLIPAGDGGLDRI